jgi:type I restriction enzyme, S subunit
MSKKWTEVRLGEVLRKAETWIDLSPERIYKEVTVRLWGQGVALRRAATGAEIRADRRLQVRAGQFILSRIDARNGAFGIIPSDLDGAVVSNDFPVFDTDAARLLPGFLGWMSRTSAFVEKCGVASEGTTNRVRLKEDKFLRLPVAIPPLLEQRRIVAKIERLAAKIEEARGLRYRSFAEAGFLLQAGRREVFADCGLFPRVHLEEVCDEIVDCLHSNPLYSETGVPTIRSPDVGWGRLFVEQARRTSEDEYRRRTERGEPQPGDIVLVREGGGTGKAAMVAPGQRLSLGQRVMQLRPNLRKVLPRFLLHQWLSPLVQEDQIADRIKGSASPHLNIGQLKRFSFILPPLDEQRRVVVQLDALHAKVERLKALQTRDAAELDALLPAVLDRAFAGEL